MRLVVPQGLVNHPSSEISPWCDSNGLTRSKTPIGTIWDHEVSAQWVALERQQVALHISPLCRKRVIVCFHLSCFVPCSFAWFCFVVMVWLLVVVFAIVVIVVVVLLVICCNVEMLSERWHCQVSLTHEVGRWVSRPTPGNGWFVVFAVFMWRYQVFLTRIVWSWNRVGRWDSRPSPGTL